MGRARFKGSEGVRNEEEKKRGGVENKKKRGSREIKDRTLGRGDRGGVAPSAIPSPPADSNLGKPYP